MAQARQDGIGEELIVVAPSRDWTLAAMAVVGGLSFLVIGLLTLSVFPMAGIIEAVVGTFLLVALMLSAAKSGR